MTRFLQLILYRGKLNNSCQGSPSRPVVDAEEADHYDSVYGYGWYGEGGYDDEDSL